MRRRGAAAWFTLLGIAVPQAAGAEPEVRILLRQTSSSVQLRGEGLVGSVDGGPSRPWASGAVSLEPVRDRVRLRPPADGTGVAGRVIVEGAKTIQVEGTGYLGRIEVVSDSEGRLTVVNRIRVETYLLGIVGSEMPAEWPLEALKAQAVAARTYALQRRLRRRAAGHPWDLRDSVLSQVYKGADVIRPSVITAVEQTYGWVLSFQHEPAEALFHSTCGGYTVDVRQVFGGDVAYLRRRPCEWCRDSTRYRWSLNLERDQVGLLLARAGLAQSFRRLERSGSEGTVRVVDRRGSRSVAPEKVRSALGFGRLYSTRFSVAHRGRAVVLEGAGFGHRVGMCQWGARGQALEGRSHRDILGHYYPGAPLKRAY